MPTAKVVFYSGGEDEPRETLRLDDAELKIDNRSGKVTLTGKRRKDS